MYIFSYFFFMRFHPSNLQTCPERPFFLPDLQTCPEWPFGAKFVSRQKIPKAWYECNGKLKCYKSYSNAKAVFQAALKKSIYLLSLERVGRKLRFRFSTKEEAKAKQLAFKEKSKGQDTNDEMSSVSLSPAPSDASSGYCSGNDVNENSQIPDDVIDGNFLDDVLEDPYKYISDKYVGLGNNLFDDLMDETENPELEDNNYDIDLTKLPMDPAVQEPQPLINDVAGELQQLICSPLPEHESSSVPVQVENEAKSVVELNPILVSSPSVSQKFFWRCKQKLIVDNATLLLICDKEIVEDANNTINEGQIFIPNEVWEPNVSYKLLRITQLGDKNFVFFSQESV